MKFYFCESCGRRLTEHDLDSGAASNKEAKGFYCSTCAVGVHTMQFTALQDPGTPTKQAAQNSTPVKRKTTHSVALPQHPHAPKRTNDINMVPAQRSGHAQESKTSPSTFSNPSKAPNSMLFFWGAGVCVLLLMAALALWPESKPPVSRKAAEAIPEPVRPTPVIERPEVSAKTNAPEDLPLREPEPKVEQKPVPDSPESKTITHPVSEAPAQKSETPPETSKTTPDEPAKPKIEPPKASKQEGWVRVLQALAQCQPQKATDILADPAFSQEERTALKTILTKLEEEIPALAASLAARVGQKVRIQTKSGATSGKILKVEGNIVSLAQEFVINGESRTGEPVAVSLLDLNLNARRTLQGSSDPTQADGWMLLAIQRLLDGQEVPARAALEKAKGHVLQEPLSAAFVAMRQEILDARASAEWTTLEARAQKARTGSDAKALLKDLDEFEKSFSESTLCIDAAHKAKRDALRADLAVLQLDADPRLIKSFRGRIVTFSPRTEELTLQYEFKNAAELEDWTIAEQGHTKITPNGLHLSCPNSSNPIMSTNLFKVNGINITMEFEVDASSKGRDPRILVWLFGSDSKGKSNPGIVLAGMGCIDYMRGDMRAPLTSSAEPLPLKGILEVACTDAQYQVKLNGKKILEYKDEMPCDQTGIRWGGGFNMNFVVKKLVLSGKYDPALLKAKLESASK